jgi:hypothetical protein
VLALRATCEHERYCDHPVVHCSNPERVATAVRKAVPHAPARTRTCCPAMRRPRSISRPSLRPTTGRLRRTTAQRFRRSCRTPPSASTPDRPAGLGAALRGCAGSTARSTRLTDQPRRQTTASCRIRPCDRAQRIATHPAAEPLTGYGTEGQRFESSRARLGEQRRETPGYRGGPDVLGSPGGGVSPAWAARSRRRHGPRDAANQRAATRAAGVPPPAAERAGRQRPRAAEGQGP